eukprot:COSAG02_NODE_1359_length_13055_cov_31.608397_3_plen_353_part_00
MNNRPTANEFEDLLDDILPETPRGGAEADTLPGGVAYRAPGDGDGSASEVPAEHALEPFQLAPPNEHAASSHSDAKQVFIYVNVFAVSDIDTVNQTFRANFFMRACWVESELGKSIHPEKAWSAHQQGDDLEQFCMAEDVWEPRLMFVNAVEPVEKTQVELRPCPWRQSPRGEPVLEWRAHCRGIFRERFELKSFPFDVQSLTIMLSTHRSRSQVWLREDSFNNTKGVVRKEFTVMAEFELDDRPYFETLIENDVVHGAGAAGRFSLLRMYFVAERRHQYYLVNICLPIFMITAMVASTFAVPPSQIASRLGACEYFRLRAATYSEHATAFLVAKTICVQARQSTCKWTGIP